MDLSVIWNFGEIICVLCFFRESQLFNFISFMESFWIIYIYICVCVCVCVYSGISFKIFFLENYLFNPNL